MRSVTFFVCVDWCRQFLVPWHCRCDLIRIYLLVYVTNHMATVIALIPVVFLLVTIYGKSFFRMKLNCVYLITHHTCITRIGYIYIQAARDCAEVGMNHTDHLGLDSIYLKTREVWLKVTLHVHRVGSIQWSYLNSPPQSEHRRERCSGWT
jgi:hypothetical protein